MTRRAGRLGMGMVGLATVALTTMVGSSQTARAEFSLSPSAAEVRRRYDAELVEMRDALSDMAFHAACAAALDDAGKVVCRREAEAAWVRLGASADRVGVLERMRHIEGRPGTSE